MLEHALRVDCSERAQTRVRTALFEEVRCDGRGFSSGVLQPDPFSVGVCLLSLGKFAGYLSLLIEGVQRKPLQIIFPGLPYRDALVHCDLRTLSDRSAAACTKFIQRVRDTGVLANLLPQRTTVPHGYNLRSGTIREDLAMASTNRLDKFITYRYS